MGDTAVEHRCGLCKKTFKQKSSLVRHAKRCTLEPTPSVRQKACRNCVEAKARCDLKRPICSRCDTRSILCAYPRPARATGTNSGPVPNTNSGPAPESGLVVDPCLGLDSGVATIRGADADLGTYPDCGTDFTNLSRCLVPFFSADSTDISDATPSSGSGFHAASCSTSSTHIPPCNSHDSPFNAGSLDVQLDLDGSPGVDADLPVALRQPRCGAGLLPHDVDLFSATEPTATMDAEDVEPWMLSLAAKHITQDPPALVEHSVQTLLRFFRSWPRMLAKGIQLPPVIHSSQFSCDGKRDFSGGGGGGGGGSGDAGMPKHISRCVTLCKMWVWQAEDSGQIVQTAARGEAENILDKYRTYDAPTLLAAMQSLMILLILLLFPSNRQGTMSVVPGHIFAAVKDMASYVLSTGMLLHEEASHVCPPWRVWAHIEAKRRTIVSIYFFHWAYSAYHGMRHFNCLQLGRMLAPGPKWLWQAEDEKTWTDLYGRWLTQWDGREFIQAEFFLVEKGPVMDSRVEMWLEDADELGLLIMSIMNASQRDLSKIDDAEANIVG